MVTQKADARGSAVLRVTSRTSVNTSCPPVPRAGSTRVEGANMVAITCLWASRTGYKLQTRKKLDLCQSWHEIVEERSKFVSWGALVISAPSTKPRSHSQICNNPNSSLPQPSCPQTPQLSDNTRSHEHAHHSAKRGLGFRRRFRTHHRSSQTRKILRSAGWHPHSGNLCHRPRGVPRKNHRASRPVWLWKINITSHAHRPLALERRRSLLAWPTRPR
jgi:hypothetical protein